MRATKLSEDEIRDRLRGLEGWAVEGDTLRKTFRFADFKQSMRFVNALANAAEAADHHPDIDIRYSQVLIGLSTHDCGGITDNDFALAKEADAAAMPNPSENPQGPPDSAGASRTGG